VKEYADFLAQHSPYSRLGRLDLNRLAMRIEVEYVTGGTD